MCFSVDLPFLRHIFVLTYLVSTKVIVTLLDAPYVLISIRQLIGGVKIVFYYRKWNNFPIRICCL